jgi:UDP-N-acetylglucosamine--N-acetylmuramyl-(pentapeptide) pyrophosphoryl-undecaprenol N-acetylglucosamine transferase
VVLQVDQLYLLLQKWEFLLLFKSRILCLEKPIFSMEKSKSCFHSLSRNGKFFRIQKLFFGNPIRENIITDLIESDLAKEKLGLEKDKLTILSVGGSLGSRTLNNGWKENLEKLKEKGYQLIWQTGKLDFAEISSNIQHPASIQIKEFISDMATAYSAADVIVSRAGAIAISELAVAKKPVLLVPFPFAAEDHQTKNAMTLVEKNAAKW